MAASAAKPSLYQTALVSVPPNVRSSGFSHSEIVLVFTVSVLLLVPCIWLPHVESFDLCSHTYNAWLTRLISEQQISGFWIAHQSTNIMVDHVLTVLMKWSGAALAQRIFAAASVLLFFWASFGFICTFSNKRPWFLLPCLAVLSYGRVFHEGFLNFYLSLAFAFLALSLVWRRYSWGYIPVAVLLALSWAAHPLPAVAAVVAVAYISTVRSASRRVQ